MQSAFVRGDAGRRSVDTSDVVLVDQDPDGCSRPLRTVDSSKQRRPRRRDSLYAHQAGLNSTLSPPLSTNVDRSVSDV